MALAKTVHVVVVLLLGLRTSSATAPGAAGEQSCEAKEGPGKQSRPVYGASLLQVNMARAPFLETDAHSPEDGSRASPPEASGPASPPPTAPLSLASKAATTSKRSGDKANGSKSGKDNSNVEQGVKEQLLQAQAEPKPQAKGVKEQLLETQAEPQPQANQQTANLAILHKGDQGTGKGEKPYMAVYIYWDFLYILVAALVYFILPRGMQESCETPDHGSLPKFLPALHSLRYLSILLVWLKDQWFGRMFVTSEFFLILSGFVLEFAEQRRELTESASTLSEKFQQFLPRRFARLYPLYALHVIIGHLSTPGPSKCDPYRALLLYQSWGYGTGTFDDGQLVYHTCGTGTWFISVIFGCYILFPILSAPMRQVPIAACATLWAACIPLIVIPRALASPVSAPNVWWDDVFHTQNQTAGIMHMLFAQRSLLHGLAHFFLGMVLARAWVAATLPGRSHIRSGFFHTMCANGCTIGLAALGLEVAVTHMLHLQSVPPNYGLRLLKELWQLGWQSMIMLGAAGPFGDSRSVDPARYILSSRPLAWMGEIALPLYLTIHWACEFSDKMLLLIDVHSMAAQVVAQLVTTHAVAFTIYQSCGALRSTMHVTKT